MERVALYYPTINVPKSAWLYNSILYSDKVSSIVPFKDSDPRFSDELKYLVDAGEYKPVWLYGIKHKYSPDFSEFIDYFIDKVESPEFQALLQQKRFIKDNYFIDLYKDKVSVLGGYLEDNGYCVAENSDFISRGVNVDTVRVEANVALLYMSLLAQHVASINREDIIIPSTDDKRYTDIALKPSTNKKSEVLNLILENCLPAPNLEVPLKKVVEFKQKRKLELLEFRHFLNNVQDKMVNASSDTELREQMILIKEEIEKEILKITRLLKDNNIKAALTSFESILKIENPKLFQTLTIGGLLSTPINPVLGVVVGTIGIVSGFASSLLAVRQEAKKSELSYLFQAKSSAIIT